MAEQDYLTMILQLLFEEYKKGLISNSEKVHIKRK